MLLNFLTSSVTQCEKREEEGEGGEMGWVGEREEMGWVGEGEMGREGEEEDEPLISSKLAFL